MSARAIRNEQDRTQILNLLASRKTPFTVNVTKGAPRSIEQNKLQRLWVNEAAEQLQDQTAEEYRGYCKLHFGVAIMKSESEAFAEKYDRLIRPLPYETKLEYMMEPLDFPVTRMMSTAGKKQYLDAMWQHFTGLGVELTDPDARGRALYASRNGRRS